MQIQRLIMIAAISLPGIGCQPASSPPDITKTQRESLNKAKALEGQLQQQAADRMKSIDQSEK